MSYTQAQGASVLRSKLGMRGSDAQVISAFQTAYNLGSWLSVDSKMGPLTSAAVARSVASDGKASANFKFDEFRCKCGGRYTSCRRVLIRRELLQSLERYRTNIGQGVSIVSGYRCPSYNTAIGGATNSQHVYGAAADVSSPKLHQVVGAMLLFAGIGYARSSGLVKHVDRRDVAGHNNGGSLGQPMKWVYAS